jgi:hypothetical protein
LIAVVSTQGEFLDAGNIVQESGNHLLRTGPLVGEGDGR